jgi:hypothetical protein
MSGHLLMVDQLIGFKSNIQGTNKKLILIKNFP